MKLVVIACSQQNYSFGRVLEAASPKLRGNIEKYMRNIDWGTLAQQCKSMFKKTLDVFIDGIDSWAVKWLAGGGQVKAIVGELRAVQKQGPKMVDEAFTELKKLHSKMLGHELPVNTAALKTPSAKPPKPLKPATGTPAAGTPAKPAKPVKPAAAPAKVSKKTKDTKTNPSQPNATKTNTKKKAKPKRNTWEKGVAAEHLTDYYVKGKHTNFKKVNNLGILIEEKSKGHGGIDHLWLNKSHAVKPFVVSDTKSSIFDSLRLVAALPAQFSKQFDALRLDEAANPIDNGKPNTFDSKGRDDLTTKRVRVSAGKEDQVRAGVNRPNPSTALATQMSHKWIADKVPEEKLTLAGDGLKKLIKKYRKMRDIDPHIPAPYQRWISLVTGRQLEKHRKAKGARHEIQIMLDLPDSILAK